MNHVPSHGPGWVVEWGVVHSLAGDPRLPTFITHIRLFLLTDPEGKLLRLRNFTGEAITGSVAQSCPTLYDHMDCSLPGPSVHGIFQARIWQWVAISSFWRSPQARDQTCVSCLSCIGRQISLPLCHLENPYRLYYTRQETLGQRLK